MRPRVWLAAILVCLFQTAAIAALIVNRAMHLIHGREMVLSVMPVDPRDLLRGDYVRLDYTISHPCPTRSFEAQRWVIQERLSSSLLSGRVHHRTGNGFRWRFLRSPAAPETDNTIVLRGVTLWAWRPDQIRVEYGIESYFVPENTGHDLEKATRDGAVKAVISVTGDGKAAIKGLIVAGTRHDESLF